MRRKGTLSKEQYSKQLGGLAAKTLIAGTSLLLAAALLQVPDAAANNGTGFSLVQAAEAEDLTLTSGKCGQNLTWSFNKSTGTLTIKGNGSMFDYGDNNSPFKECTNIKRIVIQTGVTGIGDGSFEGCSEVTAVELPSSLKSIGEAAFYGCTKLTDIRLPKKLKELSDYAFSECSSLKKITIPGSVETIGYKAFEYSSSLTEVTIEDGVHTIEYLAFNGTGVKEIFLPRSIWECSDAFYGTKLENYVVDPENETYASKDGCLYVKTQDFEEAGFAYLKQVPEGRSGVFQVPDGVIGIENGCFQDCEDLTGIILPDSVTTINGDAFHDCLSLESITIPKNVSVIEDCFRDCPSLKEIKVASGNQYYTGVSGVLYTKDMTELIHYPAKKTSKTYMVPDSVTKIHDHSFGYCTSLISLVIPAGVTEIDSAFMYQAKIEHLIFLNRKAIRIQGDDIYQPARNDIFFLHTYPDVKISGKTPQKFVEGATFLQNWTPIVDGKNAFVQMGKTVDLSRPGSVTAANWKDLKFHIKDSSVLKISSAGVVTPLKEGLTTELYAFAKTAAVHYYATTGFSDVKSTDYYYGSVYWAVDKGITGGVKDSRGIVTKFDPQGVCTRGQMISFLWRMAGCPEPTKTTTIFTDIDPNAYYYKAVLWGVEKKIVGGYADRTFRPQANCTRSQAVTFIWRYYGSPEPQAAASKFTDVTDKKAYYYNAVLWASENGITGGYSDGTFRLNGECSRAQMVTFLYRSRDYGKK